MLYNRAVKITFSPTRGVSQAVVKHGDGLHNRQVKGLRVVSHFVKEVRRVESMGTNKIKSSLTVRLCVSSEGGARRTTQTGLNGILNLTNINKSLIKVFL